MRVTDQMFPKRVILGLVLAVICLAAWLVLEKFSSPPEIMAHGKLKNGSEYCVVQTYKDFAQVGWVVGVYQRDTIGTWHMRSLRMGEVPWKKATVSSSEDFFVLTLGEKGAAETYSSQITPVRFAEIPPDERFKYARPECPLEDLVGQLIEATY